MSIAGAYNFRESDHIQEPLWTAIDHYSTTHLHPASRPNSAALIHALTNSRGKGLPDISGYPSYGKMMALNCKSRGVKRALELGTLGGYTSIWLATENPGLKITSIEIDPLHKEVAEANLYFAGVYDRVDIRLGAGLDVLPRVVEEIESGKAEKFGFVFLDADKENNWNYLDMVIPLCKSGACIFVDNMAQRGALVDMKDDGSSVVGARQVVENVGKDSRVDGVLMQMVGEKSYDGYLMAVVL